MPCRALCRLLVVPLVALVPWPAPVPGSAPAGRASDGVAREPFHPVTVATNVVTLSSLPDFRLRVPDTFTYVGSTRFRLGDQAEADVVYFAKEVGDSIERFVMVQVESLVDEEADDYAWSGEDTLRVANTEYLRGFWCFDAGDVARENPGGDTAKALEWLSAGGHHPRGVFVGTRLARVFAGGRSELLVFYGETTTITGVDCDDEETAMKHLPSIVERSEAALNLGP